MKLTKEALAYWDSITNENGNLSHLTMNDPKIQRLRVMIGIDPEVKGRPYLDINKIRKLVEETGESFSTNSARMGKSKSWLSTVLINSRTGEENIKVLADYFGVDVEEIMMEEA